MKRTLPLLLAVAACAPHPRALPSASLPPAAPPFPHATVWTRSAQMPLRGDSAAAGGTVPYLFTRLQVTGNDSASLRVRCDLCVPMIEGWVSRAAVVYEVLLPEAAAGGELAEFLLAVRDAAARRDVPALRQAMSREFTSSLIMDGGALEAGARWDRGGYGDLDRLPALLDRGVHTRGGQLWAAPPEYYLRGGYRDLRGGFRREGERWVWVFFVRGGA